MAWARLGVLLGLSAFLFSWATATFPGEWQEAHLPSAKIFAKMDESPVANEAAQSKEQSFGDWIASYLDWALNAERVSLHDWVFKSPVDGTTRRRRLPFSNTLVLTGFNVLEGLGIDDPEKVKARDFVLRARGRDLKGAIFDLAILPKVDFAGAQLEDASLNQTQLQSASLKGAELQSASLKGAELQGASLNGAQLQGASLNGAQLEGASLFSAQLQGASLDSARLEGALLFSAQLQGASLSGARLEGASLNAAQLEGARLFGAQLQAASLNAAQLEGATLDAANFEGASLDYANLQGASLQQARLTRPL